MVTGDKKFNKYSSPILSHYTNLVACDKMIILGVIISLVSVQCVVRRNRASACHCYFRHLLSSTTLCTNFIEFLVPFITIPTKRIFSLAACWILNSGHSIVVAAWKPPGIIIIVNSCTYALYHTQPLKQRAFQFQ